MMPDYIEVMVGDYENVTIQDCIDMYEKKDMRAIVSDGKIIYFVKE